MKNTHTLSQAAVDLLAKLGISAKVGDSAKSIDWAKVIAMLTQLLQLLFPTPPVPPTPTPAFAAAVVGCDHEDCCLCAVHCAAMSLQAAIACYQDCCEAPAPCFP
jgi:hypothetical protein